MASLRVCRERFLQSINDLANIGATVDGGLTRFALTDEDRQARQWLQNYGAKYGLASHFDNAGNLFIYAEADSTKKMPPLLVGSHVDTVPNGGCFDGALGVLAGLEALICLQEAEVALERPVRLAAWTEEEGSRFRGGLMGSRAFIGEVRPEELQDRDADGISLAQALEAWGLDPGGIPDLAQKPGDLHAYLELHIEQGGQLEAAGLQIGVVTGIVGIRRYNIVVEGQANHAGTTPMALRKDALAGAAEMILAVEAEVKHSGHDNAVATVGKLQVFPGGVNVVPGRVEFTLGIRDIETGAMDEIESSIIEAFEEIAARRGLGLSIEAAPAVKPAPLAKEIQQTIAAVAGQLGYSWRYMPSGAGHDAQHLARICPTGMIFVPSRGGISHSPQEFTSDDQCVQGANVLLNTIIRLLGK